MLLNYLLPPRTNFPLPHFSVKFCHLWAKSLVKIVFTRGYHSQKDGTPQKPSPWKILVGTILACGTSQAPGSTTSSSSSCAASTSSAASPKWSFPRSCKFALRYCANNFTISTLWVSIGIRIYHVAAYLFLYTIHT